MAVWLCHSHICSFENKANARGNLVSLTCLKDFLDAPWHEIIAKLVLPQS